MFTLRASLSNTGKIRSKNETFNRPINSARSLFTGNFGSSENVVQPHGVPHWGRFWGGSKYDYKIQVAIKKRLTVEK